MNLHHDAEPRAKVVLEGVAIFFFERTGPVYDGDRFNAVRLFRVISEDSAEQEYQSLDESSAFLIEGAHWASAPAHFLWLGRETETFQKGPNFRQCY